ncbi:hypothetical protein NUH88_07325 [Nisaea acidiphila]|uniref:AphA-like transcriptional regulator n=1 Tax=Nisaea acidiphila TaxID=1862145 RepID=A0A9J7AUS8_9PROT|nr:hypothetical protein [Nisaea acidiphila]UUX51499.1 hypothetical protein NUH88_07325 [Nisaea acidiphila]
MYRDNSLIPKEAIRMAALGALSGGPRAYAEIASEVRQFAARIVGPSLDLLGSSIELLKFEGLIAPVSGEGFEDNAQLQLTEEGWTALRDYLSAAVRPGVNDLNKLVVALKLRFLHLLEKEEQLEQIEALKGLYEGELARLSDLLSHEEWQQGQLRAWIEMEIRQVEDRISWCDSQKTSL